MSPRHASPRWWTTLSLGLLIGSSAIGQDPLQDGLATLLGGGPRTTRDRTAGMDAEEGPKLAPATPIGEGENTGFERVAGGRLELHARNIDVMAAMSQLRQLTRRNIVVSADVEARFTGDLYDVTFEEAITIVCKAAKLEWSEEVGFLHIRTAELITRHFVLNHSRAEDLVLLLQPMLSENGQVSGTAPTEQGIVSFASDESAGGGDYAALDVIVIRDFADRMEKYAEIIDTVDAQPRQVLVEATILSAEINDQVDIGAEIATVFGTDFDELGSTSDGTSVDLGEFPSDVINDGTITAETGLASTLPSSGLRLGFLKDGIGAFITALQTVTNTNVLASPKITTLNKQRGEVLLGRRDGFLTTTVNQTSTIQNVEFLETGTRLIYRPFITDDGYVRLEIHPEDSDGGVDEAGLPFKETTEVTTNIMVRSGETVVIGGLFREKEMTIHRKVPWLGDIPFLGELFRSRSEGTVREEIIIFLTPHIIDFAEQELISAQLDDDDDSPNPVELANSYVDAAKKLIERRKFGSADMMLNSVERLGVRLDEIDDLRRRVWRERVLEYDQDMIDGLILELLMGTPVDVEPKENR